MLHPIMNLPYLQTQRNLFISHPLVMLVQNRLPVLITVPLFNFILVKFAETLSITSVVTICAALWKCSNVKEQFFSAKYIRKLLLSYGVTLLEPIVKSHQQSIINHTIYIFRKKRFDIKHLKK
jgi:hypothetical protein